MNVSGPSRLGALVAGLALSSCATFRFQGQEIHLRHDVQADALEVGIAYLGLHARPEHVSESGTAVRRIAGGERYLLLFDWPFELDVERIVAAAREDEAEPLGPNGERAIELLDGISVVHAELFLDEQGRLCAWQHLRLSRIGDWMRLANDAVHDSILEAVREGELVDSTPLLDERTRELWAASAAAREPWVRWEAGGLEIAVPATPATAARWLASALELEDSGEDSERLTLFADLAQSLTELRIEGDLLRARFGPDERSLVHLRLRRWSWTYAPDVLESLGDERAVLETRSTDELPGLLKADERER